MRGMNRFRKRVAVAALILVAGLGMCAPSRASDVSINPASAVYVVSTSLTWGGSGPGTFNNNFYFSPLSPSENVCTYVYNNNATSAHTFKTSINVTANPAERTPSDGTWNQAAVWTNMNAPVSPGVASNISASVSGAALIAVEFSGATTQTGSPDTASVVVIQTTGSCFSGQNSSSPTMASEIAFTPLQAYSQSISSSFFGIGSVSSPSGPQVVIDLNGHGTGKSAYPQKAYISTTSTSPIQVTVNFDSNSGSGCAPIGFGGTNMNAPGGVIIPTDNVWNGCGVNPSASTIAEVSIPANGFVSIDLSGFIASANSTTGINVTTVGAITGMVYASILWYEK